MTTNRRQGEYCYDAKVEEEEENTNGKQQQRMLVTVGEEEQEEQDTRLNAKYKKRKKRMRWNNNGKVAMTTLPKARRLDSNDSISEALSEHKPKGKRLTTSAVMTDFIETSSAVGEVVIRLIWVLGARRRK